MPTHHGNEGSVAIGANAVAEVRSFSLDIAGEVQDDTVMGDAARTFISNNLYAWSGSIECLWDESDTNGQLAMTANASVTLNLYPEGSASGDNYYTGTAIITNISTGQSYDGMVETSFSFQGTGALTRGDVTP